MGVIDSNSNIKFKVIISALFLFLLFLPFRLMREANSVYLNYDKLPFSFFLRSWSPENLGSFCYFFIPYDVLVWVLFKSLPTSLANLLSFYIPQVLAALFSYKLSLYLYKNKVIAIMSAFFYTSWIFAQFTSGWSIHSGTMAYVFLPFLVYEFLTLTKSTLPIKTAKVFLVFVFFINVNLTYVVYLFMTIFVVFVYRLLVEGYSQLTLLFKGIFFTVMAYILANLPFLLTFTAETFLDRSLLKLSLAAETFEWKSSGSTTDEVFREMGSINFTYKIKDKYTYPNARQFFDNYLLILLSYMPMFILLLSFFLPYISRKIFLARIVTTGYFLIIVFFAMGANSSSPFRSLYMAMAEYIPFFKIFRESFKATFVLHFIFYLCIGFLGYYLYNFSKHKIYFALYLWFVFLSTAIVAGSYLSGSFFESELIKIPKYWELASSDYRNQYSGQNIIFTPKMNFPAYKFLKKIGGHSTFYRPLFNFQMLNPNSVYRFSDVTSYLYSDMSPQLLGLYNISLVLNQHDVHWSLYNGVNPEVVSNILQSNNYKLVKIYE